MVALGGREEPHVRTFYEQTSSTSLKNCLSFDETDTAVREGFHFHF